MGRARWSTEPKTIGKPPKREPTYADDLRDFSAGLVPVIRYLMRHEKDWEFTRNSNQVQLTIRLQIDHKAANKLVLAHVEALNQSMIT